MIVGKRTCLDSAKNITDHKCVILTKRFNLPLVAIEGSRLAYSSAFFIVVLFEYSKSVFDSLTRLRKEVKNSRERFTDDARRRLPHTFAESFQAS